MDSEKLDGAQIYLQPSEDWILENWMPRISGTPLSFRDTLALSLLTVEEAQNETVQGEDIHRIQPISMFIDSLEYLYSDVYGSSVYVMTFAEPIVAFRKNTLELADNPDYVPHIILTQGLARSKANVNFLVSLANSLFGHEIVFDRVIVRPGDTAEIYNSHIATRSENDVV